MLHISYGLQWRQDRRYIADSTTGLLAAGNDPAGGRTLIERALSLFEEIGATGWVNEARAALS